MGVDSVAEWGKDFESLWERVGACFFRHDLRDRAKGYVRGLLGRIDRKNGWQMAEYPGLSESRLPKGHVGVQRGARVGDGLADMG